MMDGQRDRWLIVQRIFEKGESGLYKIALSPSIHWATIKVIREMERLSEAHGRVCKEKSLGGRGKHSSSREVGVKDLLLRYRSGFQMTNQKVTNRAPEEQDSSARHSHSRGSLISAFFTHTSIFVFHDMFEIGQENRGRTMLERMGWSTGTALGASNNSRGLVQPVAQVVKTSRSGLG
ncbi:hypothetical protein BDR22DRAFT_241164 [Usnea florida]